MNSIISMNRCDIIMISLFFVILFAFGLYKYLHNDKQYDALDREIDNILNKKDIIIKKQQQMKTEIPKNFSVEDYRIPEFLIRDESASTLENEVKSRL